MKPTVGRIVHYTPPQDCTGKTTLEFYASFITQVNNPVLKGDTGETIRPASVELATFGPNSLYFQHAVPQAEAPTPGHWNWPPRD